MKKEKCKPFNLTNFAPVKNVRSVKVFFEWAFWSGEKIASVIIVQLFQLQSRMELFKCLYLESTENMELHEAAQM